MTRRQFMQTLALFFAALRLWIASIANALKHDECSPSSENVAWSIPWSIAKTPKDERPSLISRRQIIFLPFVQNSAESDALVNDG